MLSQKDQLESSFGTSLTSPLSDSTSLTPAPSLAMTESVSFPSIPTTSIPTTSTPTSIPTTSIQTVESMNLTPSVNVAPDKTKASEISNAFLAPNFNALSSNASNASNGSNAISSRIGQRMSFSEVDELKAFNNLEEQKIVPEPDICDWKMKNGKLCGRPVKKNGKCSLHSRLSGTKRDSTGVQYGEDPSIKRKNPLAKSFPTPLSSAIESVPHCLCLLKNGKICGKPVKLNNRCGIHGKNCIVEPTSSSSRMQTESHPGRCPCVLKSGEVCNKILKDGKTRCSRHQSKKCVPFTSVSLPSQTEFSEFMPITQSFDPEFNPTEMDLSTETSTNASTNASTESTNVADSAPGIGTLNEKDALDLMTAETPVIVENLDGEILNFEDFQEEDDEDAIVTESVVEQEEKQIHLVEEEDDEMEILEGSVAWKEYQVTEDEMLQILKETMITDISTKQLEFLESEIENCFF